MKYSLGPLIIPQVKINIYYYKVFVCTGMPEKIHAFCYGMGMTTATQKLFQINMRPHNGRTKLLFFVTETLAHL
jgi:hypothetical protein